MEGFAKLALLGRLVQTDILLKLVLLYFSPATEGILLVFYPLAAIDVYVVSDDMTLRQCLSLFFPAFVATCDAHAAAFRSAVLPSLRRVWEAPATEALTDALATAHLSAVQLVEHIVGSRF